MIVVIVVIIALIIWYVSYKIKIARDRAIEAKHDDERRAEFQDFLSRIPNNRIALIAEFGDKTYHRDDPIHFTRYKGIVVIYCNSEITYHKNTKYNYCERDEGLIFYKREFFVDKHQEFAQSVVKSYARSNPYMTKYGRGTYYMGEHADDMFYVSVFCYVHIKPDGYADRSFYDKLFRDIYNYRSIVYNKIDII